MAQLIMPAVAAIKAGGMSAALMAGGTILSTAGTIAAGSAANSAAKFEAKQLTQRATAERGTASHKAQEEHRQKRLVQSRARAVGAASGGGLDYGLDAAIEEEGTYRAMVALWEGEEAARGFEAQADARRFEGQQKQTASYLQAGSRFASGYSSLMDDFGPSLNEKYAGRKTL